MRHLKQRCQSDCFPTCIAMVTGLSYRQAISLVHPFRSKYQSYETFDDHAVKVLRSLGFRVRKRYLRSFVRLKQPALLVIEYKGTGHVAVWDPERRQVLDPSKYPFPTVADYKKHLLHVFILS